MKNILLIIAFAISIISVRAQDTVATKNNRENPNFVKLNLLTFAGGKVSLEYERILSKRLSVGVAFNLRPENDLPFKSKLMDAVDDDEINVLIDGMKTSSTAIIPEVRIYLSKSGYGRGFYIAPYGKYAKLDYATPYSYDISVEYMGEMLYDRKETIPLTGDMTTMTVGLSMGVNFKLSKNLFLDWRIIGPGYGVSKGRLAGEMALNIEEQESLDFQLNKLKASLYDLPGKFEIDYNVHSNGAEVNLNKNPWGSLRSGLSIAYKF